MTQRPVTDRTARSRRLAPPRPAGRRTLAVSAILLIVSTLTACIPLIATLITGSVETSAAYAPVIAPVAGVLGTLAVIAMTVAVIQILRGPRY